MYFIWHKRYNMYWWYCFQNVYAPENDPELIVEVYERSFQQNEELGLNDMKTEDY